MTRFGVMAHLKVLETAGLITTRKSGRDKLHFLATDVIRQVQGDWFDKYGRPLPTPARAEVPSTSETSRMVFVTYLQASPAEVWAALTLPDLTAGYYYGNRIESSFETGAPYAYRNEDGEVEIAGVITSVRAQQVLEMTFEARWREDVAAEPSSRVAFELAPDGPVTRLTLTHEAATGSLVAAETAGGWPYILAALKTLLETGRPMGQAAASASNGG